ncbi:hypothetical protein BR1R3_37050 [Pseudomonas atacamensis]|jgi:hypothetical protein|uniref:hypothetical protein n=1 Tax=Pseudomonas atacamensis TaxID=2565368 RepID=UPI0022C47AF6|nr:hypothetical protein [Pseudomonas atacamensis]GLH20963.1 hypothetical protein BR1R3_37050 [Pseudomonas atacamensis]
MTALIRFHEAASEALEKIATRLPADAKICLAVYTAEKPESDILLKDPSASLDEVVSTLRRRGLSIDGDNAYKRDLLDAVVGSLALGAQNSNPPPSSHWATRFWEIGREERELHEELVAALKLTRENLRACQATIHLCGGFDPAYVDDAQAAMKVADAVLAKAGA